MRSGATRALARLAFVGSTVSITCLPFAGSRNASNCPRRDATLANLREQLLAFRDPANGKQVIETVDPTNASVANARVAPDLIVGYARGYRASWQTALGGVPAPLIYDNTDAWIGDHCINPADVPGILFTNRQTANPNPGLRDVTVSVMNAFGVKAGAGMSGRSIY